VIYVRRAKNEEPVSLLSSAPLFRLVVRDKPWSQPTARLSLVSRGRQSAQSNQPANASGGLRGTSSNRRATSRLGMVGCCRRQKSHLNSKSISRPLPHDMRRRSRPVSALIGRRVSVDGRASGLPRPTTGYHRAAATHSGPPRRLYLLTAAVRLTHSIRQSVAVGPANRAGPARDDNVRLPTTVA